jgi:hypothetical protein
MKGWKNKEINYSESFMMIMDIKELVKRFLNFHHETLFPEGGNASP